MFDSTKNLFKNLFKRNKVEINKDQSTPLNLQPLDEEKLRSSDKKDDEASKIEADKNED